MSEPSLREVRVEGGLLPVWMQAEGPTALVFLHYWGGSRRTFAPVIARLSCRCTAVVYDQRGWGAARDLPGPYGIDQLADDVIDVVRELEIGRFVLVGHSMGGKVAQLAAGLREQVITDSLARNPDALLAWPLHGMTQNITDAAGLIKVPVHVLAGCHDLVEPPASLEADLLPFIAGARMTVLDGTGHLSPLEVPDLIAHEIDQYVDALAQSWR